jgi:hypothetical protein
MCHMRCTVTNSLEAEVEKQGQLKRGKYIDSVWVCNDCAGGSMTVSEINKMIIFDYSIMMIALLSNSY